MIDTSEKDFEAKVEAHLLASGYTSRLPEQYDRSLCVDPGALFDFIRSTQAKTWEKLKAQHGEQVKDRFLKRLVKEIETRGTLDVLRRGITDLGCHFDLAYFRPETTMNEEHARLYKANIISVVRQLKYSQKNDNSIDLVLFVNGLPVITAELKNPLKGQDFKDAIWQYRNDRDPKEPLLAFKRCLAHFAVDTDLAYMTARLRGKATDFLPFNKGKDTGAGNPTNPNGFKTAYLWEEVWQRDSLLDIIQSFLELVDLEDDKGRKTGEQELIFPRYHQLDAVRGLVQDAKKYRTGRRYLVEHSAGSGKSNSIAWLCHHLACLHDFGNRRIFDSIIVVTDRRVLDWQLQRTVRSFEHVKGVVTTIEHHKAENLAKALERGDDIIITTLQTFPFVAEKISTLSSKTFAVVIDEAHSSQTGESTRSMKQVLDVVDLEKAEEEEKAEGDDEDAINAAIEAQMKQRGQLPNVSYFAFTATPKNKTLELFGAKQPDGTFAPFSLYSMRQAIEEKFILDVLKNYTTYRVYFGLMKKIEGDPNYEKGKAAYLLKSFADLHEHGIHEKTKIMVEHFHEKVRHRIDGLAKAMVVTRSRLHAVRFKRAFDRYLKEKGYPYRVLVAFSGTVHDPETGLDYTEANMNGLPETKTAETFKGSEFRFLIVANKFQTGFDQPLLHTMYVDKKLGGVNAVQTLSRLNRVHAGKDDPLVLDFANDAKEIQDAFQPYYECTLLSEPTDPNKLYDLKRIIEDYHLFGQAEVDSFAKVYFSKTGKQEKLLAILDPVVDRHKATEAKTREEFRKHLGDYVRLYAFLSQLLTFTDNNLEKFYQFGRHLLRKLTVREDQLPREVTDQIDMDSYRIQLTSSGEIKLLAEDGTLKPISALGTGALREEERAPLSEIIQYINDHYGTDFTDSDKVRYFAEDMERRLTDREGLRNALDPAVNPAVENRKLAFGDFFSETLEDMITTNVEIYKKITDDPNFGALFREFMFTKLASALSRSADAGR
jgi:type I restriction enzyme, R subunit